MFPHLALEQFRKGACRFVYRREIIAVALSDSPKESNWARTFPFQNARIHLLVEFFQNSHCFASKMPDQIHVGIKNSTNILNGGDMNALTLLLSMVSLNALAANFDIGDPKILGQYVLAEPDENAEIKDLKIIYNIDNQLVLVRDNDQEYELTKADAKGVIYQGEDEPNCGSGDEPDCYYDARIRVILGETKNENAQTIPQVTIEVDRIDAYQANEDYSFKLVFNWKSPIADAVPYYTRTKTPTPMAAILESCKKTFGEVFGKDHEYIHNRVCHTADAFRIRKGVDPKLAFNSLTKDWGNTKPIKKDKLQAKLFNPSDAYIDKYAADRKVASASKKLIAAANKVRHYIVEIADDLKYDPAVGSMAWLFVLDSRNGMMYRHVIFVP